jgi:glyoxylase-like metal-dependent hydrolase (beta-lactamase superfamily II)
LDKRANHHQTGRKVETTDVYEEEEHIMVALTVHTYTASESGLFVNSYLLEAESGVVVIDTNLLNSDIAALKARLVALKKPLLAVFVTHAHPDHFNGVLELVRARDVPVYATAGVGQMIRDVADAKRAQWGPVYGAEWPAETAYPTVALANREPIKLDGLSVTARELGQAESHADSYFLVTADDGTSIAFTGDIGFNGMHPYTADGHTTGWLETLDVLSDELADMRRLLPGHGAPTDPRLFADQRRYLLYYREVVRGLASGAPRLTGPDKAELERSLQRFLPGAPLSWMIGLGADAVAAELASAIARPAEPSGAGR